MSEKIRIFLVLTIAVTIAALSGCSGTAQEAEAPSACTEISVPWRLKQIALDGDAGWALTLEEEILQTDQGIGEFGPVRKTEELCGGPDAFIAADFVDHETAFLTYFSEDGKDMVIDRTQDGGQSWEQTRIPHGNSSDAGFLYPSFSDPQNGFLLYCSTPGAGMMVKLLFRTTDGGETFSPVCDLTDTLTGYPQGITFYDDKNGYIGVTYHGQENYLYRTQDGGLTWESESLPLKNKGRYIDGFAPVFRDEAGDGLLVLRVVDDAAEYRLLTTRDFGNTWAEAGSLPMETLYSYSAGRDGGFFLIDQAGVLYEYR